MRSIKIAVLADTHVPDRIPALAQEFLATLQAEKVDLILHAGDICVQRVIDKLSEIAPVKAVRGNRDFLLFRHIPLIRQFEVFDIKFALMHGHINFIVYWWDKFLYVIKGYQCSRYIERLIKTVPDAKIYVFGHTHHAENLWQDGVLFFNPGSITYGDFYSKSRSWGIIEITEEGKVTSRIIPFDSE